QRTFELELVGLARFVGLDDEAPVNHAGRHGHVGLVDLFGDGVHRVVGVDLDYYRVPVPHRQPGGGGTGIADGAFQLRGGDPMRLSQLHDLDVVAGLRRVPGGAGR